MLIHKHTQVREIPEALGEYGTTLQTAIADFAFYIELGSNNP